MSNIGLPPWLIEGIHAMSYDKEEAADLCEYFSHYLARHLSPGVKTFWDEMSQVMIAEGESAERDAFAFMGIDLGKGKGVRQ